jgi:phosphoribosylformimino-5-aminoimidazole carboxamide ribotide isomerase
MDIIPAIDIRGGKCVQLVQGDYARETVFGVDPVAMAQHWVSQGAKRLHVVDLDAAKEGRPVNDAVIRRIVVQAGVPVQVAGGVRDHAAIHQWVESGAQRVVIGTLAVERPEVIEKAMVKHGDAIAIAIDARGGKAAVKGWLETSDTTVEAFIHSMTALGVRHFIYTDISRDGMLQHPDFGVAKDVIGIIADTGAPATLIYSGGVTSIEDVITLNEYDLEGAIIGTALYDGRIDLEAAQLALATGNGTG